MSVSALEKAPIREVMTLGQLRDTCFQSTLDNITREIVATWVLAILVKGLCIVEAFDGESLEIGTVHFLPIVTLLRLSGTTSGLPRKALADLHNWTGAAVADTTSGPAALSTHRAHLRQRG